VGHHPRSDIRLSLTADVKPAVPITATIRLDLAFYPWRTVLAGFDEPAAHVYYTSAFFTTDYFATCKFRPCKV
jgi:hypothetical protein